MKKYFISGLAVVLSCMFLYSCQKFLRVDPIDKLTGNNFYKNRGDLELALNGMYRLLYQKYTLTNTAGATGEFRAGDVIPKPGPGDFGNRIWNYKYIELLGGRPLGFSGKRDAKDGLKAALFNTDNQVPEFKISTLTNWDDYFKVIQAANILVSKLEEGVPGLTNEEKNRFEGEAKFLRNYCYFFMVQLYGDVPYYSDAYFKDPIPRENFVSVLNKCIADLNTVKDRAPWAFTDPSQRGVRAQRGAITVLLMHMNMWNAGFDAANQNKYYEATAKLGDEIIQSKAHRLYPLKEWTLVIKGRTEESLFELFQSINYNERPNIIAPFVDAFLHYPYRQPAWMHEYSNAVFSKEFVDMAFPIKGQDGREKEWFERLDALTLGVSEAPPIVQAEQPHYRFNLLKFAKNKFLTADDVVTRDDANPDNTFLIYRYADAILLHAEALAELGREPEAIASYNIVRSRALAPGYTGGGGQDLKDAIFRERTIELLGEGHRYFDLIRTKKISNEQWTKNPLTSDQFQRGGWTWPIDGAALNNNPYMTLNSFWF